MATTGTAALPEQGQLVQVRSRQWIVNDVRLSTLPDPALKPAFAGPQNLITLSSVEDDGLGEELQVVWEIEPGARVIEKAALPNPTGFDAPDKLDAFLDAVRWGAWRKLPWLNMFGDDTPPGELRAVKVIPNNAAQEDGFFIPTNMRIPVRSVIHGLFDAEPMTDDDGQECMSQWESQGKSLPKRTVVVEGRKVGDRVIAIVQPVAAKRKKKVYQPSPLFLEQEAESSEGQQ